MLRLQLVRILFLVSLPIQCLIAQERFDSGPYKGFVRASIEHITVEMSEPFEVSSVHGVIRDVSGNPMPRVIFEIRDSRGEVRGGTTDLLGKFKIPNTSPGNYIFKATYDGFQSVVGKIIVSKNPHKKVPIRLRMWVGV